MEETKNLEQWKLRQINTNKWAINWYTWSKTWYMNRIDTIIKYAEYMAQLNNKL